VLGSSGIVIAWEGELCKTLADFLQDNDIGVGFFMVIVSIHDEFDLGLHGPLLFLREGVRVRVFYP
jgi:hypothetical protein